MKKSSNYTIIKELFLKYKKKYIIILILMFLISFVKMIPVILIKDLADAAKYDILFFIKIALFFLFAGTLHYALLVAKTYLYTNVSITVLTDSMKLLLKKLVYSKWLSLQKLKIGEIFSTVEKDSSGISANISYIIVTFTGNIFDLVMAFITLLYLNVDFSLLSLLIIPVLFIILKKTRNALQKAIQQRRERQVDIQVAKTDVILGLNIIKLYNLQENKTKAYNESVKKFISSVNNHRLYESVTNNSANLIAYFLFALIIIYGGNQYLNNEITIGILIASYSCVFNLYSPLQAIFVSSINLSEVKVAYERISEYLDFPTEEPASDGIIQNTNIDSIDITNVSLFIDEKQILNNINLSLNSPGIYGITGESGAGKTSLVNLLYKFYEDYRGDIIINNSVNLKDISPKDIRNKLGVVPQDLFLFNTSVMENLKLAAPDNIKDNDIINFCKKYKIDRFIEKLPQKYNTIIGQGGHPLSRGEKQRITLIRALLNNPEIIILDEATNSIDPSNDKLFSEILEEVSKDKIIIIISHELWKIKNCKKIFLLKNGCVSESGCHNELLNEEGEYAKLYNHSI